MSESNKPSIDQPAGERVQKLIAQAGIASRRDAEELIKEGQVTINGKTAVLGDKATLGVDAIKVKGKLIHVAQNKVYYMIYKPKNYIAMIAEDEEGRPTLRDLTHKLIKERVFTVGRMDFKGEGAIILTNDGEMSQKILKSNEIIRRYHVKVDRHPTQEDLAKLARGGRLEGRSMVPYHVRVVENYNRNSLIEVSFEGMGAVDVKTFFENKGFFPEKVARVGIGHISAENLQPGQFKKLNPSSVEALFLQPELAKKAIERLTEKRTAGVRAVDEAALQKDAEKKRRGKAANFVTKTDRMFKPTGFVRGDRTEKSEKPTRKPRGFGGERPARSFGGERPARGFGGERPARGFGGERPARGFGGERPARGFGGERPARASAERPTRSYSKPAARAERPSGRTDTRSTRSAGDTRPALRAPAPSKIRFKRTVR